MRVHERRRSRFRHEAFLYASPDEFVQGTTDFIGEGLAAGEAVLVVLDADKIGRLTAALGVDADRVRFSDMTDVGANPARIIPAWIAFANQCRDEGVSFRGIGEPIWPGRSPDELVECQRHESLLNLAFDATDHFRLLCPYDAGALRPDVIEEARRSHPQIRQGAVNRPSDHYRRLEEVAAPFDAPLPEPTGVLAEFHITLDGLRLLRRHVIGHAVDAGLEGTKIDGLALAVNEVATNSVVHGGGRGTLRLWRHDTTLVCEVRDGGRIDDPLVGRVPPPASTEGGRGLWLATQLCDLIQVRRTATGSVVRLHMRSS